MQDTTFEESFQSLGNRLPYGTRWLWQPFRLATGLNQLERRLSAAHTQESSPLTEALMDAMGIKVRFVLDKDWTPNPKGPLVVVANHPFGIAEGPVALSLLKPIRPDIRLVVNRVI